MYTPTYNGRYTTQHTDAYTITYTHIHSHTHTLFRFLYCLQLCDDIRNNLVRVDRETAIRLSALMLQGTEMLLHLIRFLLTCHPPLCCPTVCAGVYRGN